MSKPTRKRKSEIKIEVQIDEPKPKHKPYDERAQAEDDALDKILFGGSTTFMKNLEEAEQEEAKKDSDSDRSEIDSDKECEIKSAWDDEDNEITVGQALKAQHRTLPNGGINDRSNNYSNLLQHKFESLHARPKWARVDRPVEDSDEDDEILQTCGFTKKQPSLFLPPSILEYKETRNLNSETYNEGPYINAIEFLKESTVALIAGQSGCASLYAVHGKKNTKLHSIKYQNYPIFCAKIIENSQEVFFGSRHPYFHSFDLMAAKSTKVRLPSGLTTCKKFNISSDQSLMAIAGKCGEVHLMSTRTKERICVLKQNDDVTALSFGSGTDLLYSHSSSGEITIFDVNMRRVKHKFMDEGCLEGTTIAISPSNRFLAAGSAQGVVNLYDTHSIYQNEAPKPEKALMNLTTKISSIAFNCTSEMLGYASADIPNSVKLYHVGTHNTFKNFPSFQTKFGNINIINFSPNSGYVAFGNSKSAVSLCRLNHYKNY